MLFGGSPAPVHPNVRKTTRVAFKPQTMLKPTPEVAEQEKYRGTVSELSMFSGFP
jgi:hypothetical protein